MRNILLVIEAFTKVAEYVAELGLDVAKEHYDKRIDEEKLKAELIDYIVCQQKYNEVCSLDEEIDYQGLIMYIREKLIDAVTKRIFDPNSRRRGDAREKVKNEAIVYCNATTENAKQRVAKFVVDSLDIIRSFYVKKIDIKYYLLASDVIDAVNANTETTVLLAQNIVVDKINEQSDRVAKLIADCPLYSIDKMIVEAKKGNLDFTNTRLNEILSGISSTHPLFPLYGYDIQDGSLISKPLTLDATSKFPMKYKITGHVQVEGKNYNNSTGDPFDFAYRHQLAVVMDVKDAKKYLGDIEDPAQYETDKLIGGKVIAHPPAFPPAFPCSIKVKDVVYYEYVLLRTQEILDDGTFVIGNKEQVDSHLYFEIRINFSDNKKIVTNEEWYTNTITKQIDFKMKLYHPTNKEILNFICFMRAASIEQDLRIYMLNTHKNLVIAKKCNVKYAAGFKSIEEEIDFFERICDIEKYYGVTLNLHGDVDYDKYNLVLKISNLVRNGVVQDTWNSFEFSRIMDSNLRKRLTEMNSPIRICYIQHMDVDIWDAKFKVKYMRILNSALLQDYGRIIELVKLLKDGELISLKFRPDVDKTYVDTLKIPEEMEF